MAMEKEKILGEFYSLPQDAQQQVVDFIAFLQARYKPMVSERKTSRKQISSESFVGIWKDREDMSNSSSWVRNARETEWGNPA